MSAAEQIPNVERYEASQGEDSSQFRSKPGHDQSHSDPDRPNGQADPFLRRRLWAVASHGFTAPVKEGAPSPFPPLPRCRGVAIYQPQQSRRSAISCGSMRACLKTAFNVPLRSLSAHSWFRNSCKSRSNSVGKNAAVTIHGGPHGISFGPLKMAVVNLGLPPVLQQCHLLDDQACN